MPVEAMPIVEIKPNPRNVRTHSAKQIWYIAKSIAAFGFTNPLVVTEAGELYRRSWPLPGSNAAWPGDRPGYHRSRTLAGEATCPSNC